MNIKDVDSSKLSQAMKQYYDIKMENMDTVVFFQLGDFYELFFEDAIEISNLLELTLTGKKAGIEEKIPMAGIPIKAIDDYLNILMEHDKKVAIVDQVDEVVLGSKLVPRRLRKVITPGTFQSQNNKDNVYIAALTNEITPKISYVDVSTADAYNMEFINIMQAIDEIIKVGIKEIVVDFNLDEDIENMLKHYGISCNKIKNENLNFKAKCLPEMKNVNSLLVTYLSQIKNDVSHISNFEIIESDKFMRMSTQAQSQLELTKTLKTSEYTGTLFWYLNKTNTAMGRRLLKRWINRPLTELSEIINRNRIVEYYVTNYSHIQLIEDELKQIYDFERIIGRLNDNVISPKEMWQLKKSISRLGEIKNFLLTSTSLEVNKLGEDIDTLEDLHNLLDISIKENNLISPMMGDIIKFGYNKEIDRLNDVKNNSTQWLIDFEIQEKEKTKIKNLKIKYNKIFGYFIEVTNSQLSLVPENYVRKQTMANCERYITDELKAAENEILNAQDLVNKLEYEEFSKIKKESLKCISRLKIVANTISKIDVLLSFAKVSYEDNLVKPEFTVDNEIEIIDSSHPIVAKMVNNFIVNDFRMNNDINTLLITGPNMAGKSTYMRQLALIAVMAQIGMFVPAKKAKLKIFDQIFTRIGASDDISQGQSTFMVEMSETAYAMKNATNDSLLLFDELGRGTSTYDGIALAKAIIQYLSNNFNVKTLFSTHYHELTDLENILPTVKNVHVKAEEENEGLTFYHKVIPGAVQKSYGIEVASLAKLPIDIIYDAKKNIKELEKAPNNLKQVNFDPINNEEVEKLIKLEKENQHLKEILTKVELVDINNMTPMQALTFISDLKNNIK